MKWGKKMKKLKPVHYHGYIYWILMILGIFAGRVFDGFSLDTLISISIIVGFTLFGDIVTQLSMCFPLYGSFKVKLSVIKYYRSGLIVFIAFWTGIISFPAFIYGLTHGLFTTSLIELVLLILLLLNKIRWMNYQVKEWQIKHNV